MFKEMFTDSVIERLEKEIDQNIQEMENDSYLNYLNESLLLNEFGEVCKATKASMDNHKIQAKKIKKEFKDCKSKYKKCNRGKQLCKEYLANCMQPKADAIEKHKEDYKNAKEKSKKVCLGKKLLKGAGNLLGKGAKALGKKMIGK